MFAKQIRAKKPPICSRRRPAVLQLIREPSCPIQTKPRKTMTSLKLPKRPGSKANRPTGKVPTGYSSVASVIQITVSVQLESHLEARKRGVSCLCFCVYHLASLQRNVPFLYCYRRLCVEDCGVTCVVHELFLKTFLCVDPSVIY